MKEKKINYILFCLFVCLFFLLFSTSLSFSELPLPNDEKSNKILIYSFTANLSPLLIFRGVRPFGVSLLIAGYDDLGPHLYQVDPSGSYWAWKASAIGKNMINAKTFLEKRQAYSDQRSQKKSVHSIPIRSKPIDHHHDHQHKHHPFNRYTDEMELEDAIHTAILTLKEGFDGQMNENNIEIGVIGSDRIFRILMILFFFFFQFFILFFFFENICSIKKKQEAEHLKKSLGFKNFGFTFSRFSRRK